MNNSAAEIQFPLNTPEPRQKEKLPSGMHRPVIGRAPRVTQVLALAIQFQEMIQRGDAHDYSDLARLGCVSRERMSQIMELVWLAPDIQQEILEFPPNSPPRFVIAEVPVRRIAAHLDWEEQRRLWRKLKEERHLE